MDNLVLIRVAAALHTSLQGAIFEGLRHDGPLRYRLILLQRDRPRTIVVSLDPERPWIGRPVTRAGKRKQMAFGATMSRTLRGLVLESIEKPPADRRVQLVFADGHTLIAELAPPRPNLIVTDPNGLIVAVARHTRGSRERLTVGERYERPPIPANRPDPFPLDATEIEEYLRSGTARGLDPGKAIARTFFGIGKVAAELVAEQSRHDGRGTGTVLAERLQSVVSGNCDPVIDGEGDPLESAREGTLSLETCRLLPWQPDGVRHPPGRFLAKDDPAATAGLYHEAIDLVLFERRRVQSLFTIVRRELLRVRHAESKVAEDATRFEQPERFRLWAEALLAGLHDARRTGGHVFVTDPYDAGGASVAVPVDPRKSVQQAAGDYFDLYRRAQRGLKRAGERAGRLARRRVALELLGNIDESSMRSSEKIDALEAELRDLGIPVGLESRGAAAIRTPGRRIRVEGLRIFRTRDGRTVLVGKNGRDNHRLTFKIAGPEDFWLHAADVPGAHVILRNEDRQTRPSVSALDEAASAAAWYSSAGSDGFVEVRWTRRKYVRQVRGAPPGTVTIKKFETVRIRPRQPTALAG